MIESETLATESAAVVGPALALLSVAFVLVVELIRHSGTALVAGRP